MTFDKGAIKKLNKHVTGRPGMIMRIMSSEASDFFFNQRRGDSRVWFDKPGGVFTV